MSGILTPKPIYISGMKGGAGAQLSTSSTPGGVGGSWRDLGGELGGNLQGNLVGNLEGNMEGTCTWAPGDLGTF